MLKNYIQPIRLLCERSCCNIYLPLIVGASACDVRIPVSTSAPDHEFCYIWILSPFI